MWVYDKEKTEEWYLLKTGHNISENKSGITLGYYKEYDAYWKMHGDTHLTIIDCKEGFIDTDGIYHIKYIIKDDYIENRKFEVQFKDLDTGYRFISNKEI